MKRLPLLLALLCAAVVSTAKAVSAPRHTVTPVILTAGQSNADGRVPIDELPLYARYHHCLWSYGSGDFVKADGTFTTFAPTVGRSDIGRRWGFDAITYYLLEQYWQRPFYVIKQTMGGTAIDTTCTKSTHGWFWSADAKQKSLLRAFFQQIDDCLKQLPKDYDIKCLLWHQGESDQPTADRYYDNLKGVVDGIRRHLVKRTGRQEYATLPVVCGTYAKGSRQASPKVVEALRQLARNDKHFHVVDASDLSLQRDRLHFDARAAETLGQRVFARMRAEGIVADEEQGMPSADHDRHSAEPTAYSANGSSNTARQAFKGVWPVTDRRMQKSLNGQWLLKVVKGIGDSRQPVPEADASWRNISVPGCWEAYGFCEPRYDYPDSLTGYYRTTFTVPESWRGQHVYIRLDGVLRGYDLWLNGQHVGTWQSAYNSCLFDLTPYLTRRAFKGEAQQLAMRVCSRFKGYEFDCFDDWAAMGIFRDVTLMAVPTTHLSDLSVTTYMDGRVIVRPTVANATRHTTVSYELTDAEGHVVSTGSPVANPRLWTAETPYLYTLRLHLKERGKTLQTFTHKIGIREITIAGNVLKVNGKPVKLRGVNAHSTDPRTVKVIDDSLTLKDMHMMKAASVNFLRLSHYPREPRFYELADSLGFYLVDEVPFGFGDKHLSDRSYQDILLTRAQATVQRDKLHPSVILWSVGNENPLPQTCIEVGNYVGGLDPSRPYCFPQVGSYFRRFWEKAKSATANSQLPSPFPSPAPVYAPHYPTTGQIGGFYQHLDRPVVFTEYCHTLGVSFEDHDRQWDIIERTPGIAGGAVWEWADQGMSFGRVKGKGKSEKFAAAHYGYEEKVYTTDESGFEMYGNKGTDGLVYADRTPLPNYYELQHNYARAFVRSAVPCQHADVDSMAVDLTIANRYDFLNLQGHVTFRWALTNDRDTIARGTFSPACQPRSTASHTLTLPRQQGLSLLLLDVDDSQGHTILRQSFVLNKPHIDWTPSSPNTHHPSPTTPQTQAGPLLRVGRKPTMAEQLKVKGQRVEQYLQPIDNPYVKADISTTADGNGVSVDYKLTPDSTDTFLSELGVAYLLDQRIDRVQWIGQGPFATYPGRRQANRYGLWAMSAGDLYFEGNRMGVDAALLTDHDGNGLLVVGDSLNLSFEQTDRGIVMTVNAAVSGQGPKFARTAFPVVSRRVGTVGGTFRLYPVSADQTPAAVSRLFQRPADVRPPFRPFVTQYDTYLMRYSDIRP